MNRATRHMCQQCKSRKAISFVHGRAGYRPDHPLCPRCWRRLVQAVRARFLSHAR